MYIFIISFIGKSVQWPPKKLSECWSGRAKNSVLKCPSTKAKILSAATRASAMSLSIIQDSPKNMPLSPAGTAKSPSETATPKMASTLTPSPRASKPIKRSTSIHGKMCFSFRTFSVR